MVRALFGMRGPPPRPPAAPVARAAPIIDELVERFMDGDLRAMAQRIGVEQFDFALVATERAVHALLKPVPARVAAALRTEVGAALRVVEPAQMAPGPLVTYIDLYPHQHDAVAWMLWRETQPLRGGILADATGMGKTVTMLTLCRTAPVVFTILVCPLSCVEQWRAHAEAAMHGTATRVCVVDVGRHVRAQFDADPSFYIVATTRIKTAADAVRAAGFVRNARLIVDEADMLGPKMRSAFMSLPAATRWALTGTPWSRSPRELNDLIELVRGAPVGAAAAAPGGAFGVAQIRQMMVRRGLDTLRLPAVHRHVVRAATPAGYAAVEEAVRNQVRQLDPTLTRMHVFAEALRRAAFDGGGVINMPTGGGLAAAIEQNLPTAAVRERIPAIQRYMGDTPECAVCYAAFTRPVVLACDHVFCIECVVQAAANTDGMTLPCPICRWPGHRRNMCLLARVIPSDAPPLPPQAVAPPAADECKAGAARRLVAALPPDECAVLVSHFPDVLAAMRTHMPGVGIIDGATPLAERVRLLDEFATGGTRAIMITVRAAGVGLNLQRANHLVLLDAWVNQRVATQLTGRVLRIGQQREVHVHTIVAAGTIDERVCALGEVDNLTAPQLRGLIGT
jgi:hypothetical protein